MAVRMSIIVPSLNQGSFLRRTIDSVLSQEESEIELLVVDGGSTDETLSVLKSLARVDTRVRWISEPDRGQAHAVNKGIARTTGPVIGWLNSDDIYYPGALATILGFLEESPETDVVYGEGDHIDETGRILGRYPTEPWNPERLQEADFLSQPSVFFRRTVVESCGPLDESLHFSMDYEYWLRLARSGKRFAYVPRVLSGTRLHDGAKTIKSRVQAHAEINTMLKAKLGRVPDAWLLNYACVASGADLSLGLTTPFRALAVLPIAIHASLKWNGALSPRSIGRWAAGLGEKASRALGRAA